MNSLTLKTWLGCWLHERWRTELALLPCRFAARRRIDWKWLCNRHERLRPGDGDAVVCDWEYSSLLTVARFFPHVGARLLRCCLQEWPVVMGDYPPISTNPPRISVILPVGGSERLPLFRAVVASFRGQTVNDFEIIAVEHAEHPEFEPECPEGVRHITIPREPGRDFNKSLAMNAGVQAARADIVLLHDADVVVPTGYLASIINIIGQGWEAVRPARFVFLCDQESSSTIVRGIEPDSLGPVAEVLANFPGLSTALTRDAYWRIGGHDERFEGWGGEDDEFLDRLATLRLYRGGYCPVIHLWHPSAPKKVHGERNLAMLTDIRTMPVEERIEQLRRQLHQLEK